MSITGETPSPDTEHTPMIKLVRTNLTQHGQWQEWSVGCICGFYKTTTSTHYIPSRESAERLYNLHLPSFTIEEAEETETPEEARERWASTFLEKV